jgi:hypothetical protein
MTVSSIREQDSHQSASPATPGSDANTAPAGGSGAPANGTAGNGKKDTGKASQGSGCTQAQLRRFIKSRPYVPMHELRRRFELNGAADDVNPITTSEGVVFVGLPSRESGFIAELVRQGEIGIELCHDPAVPMVVGVYATRPIAR